MQTRHPLEPNGIFKFKSSLIAEVAFTPSVHIAAHNCHARLLELIYLACIFEEEMAREDQASFIEDQS